MWQHICKSVLLQTGKAKQWRLTYVMYGAEGLFFRARFRVNVIREVGFHESTSCSDFCWNVISANTDGMMECSLAFSRIKFPLGMFGG